MTWSIVTGASSGIGEAVTQRLLKEGRRVAAWARRADRLVALGSDLANPAQFRAAVVNVRDPAMVAAAVADLDGEIELLVNNAGLSLGLGALADGDPADWDTMIDTNIRGVLTCTRAVLPVMCAAGRGHIVNIGSLAASYPFYGGNVYAASKAFVHHLSANLRTELQGTGVRITCIAPGMVRSEFALVRFGGSAVKADALYRDLHPLSPADVADAVLWACSVPPTVSVNLIELMPADQAFGLALGSARGTTAKGR